MLFMGLQVIVVLWNFSEKRGGKYILDRACPHIEYQNELLLSEAKELQVKFHKLGLEILLDQN